MPTNKTPIQELIDWISEIENSIFGVTGLKVETDMLRDFKKGLVRYLPKEKAFAFDCFQAGGVRGYQNAIFVFEEEKTAPNFDKFYSQFANHE